MAEVIENLIYGNTNTRLNVADKPDVLVRNCKFTDINDTLALDVRRNAKVRLEYIDILGGTTKESKWEYGLRFGYSGIPTDSNGRVEIDGLRVFKIGTPYAGYDAFNRDCIAYEEGNGPLFIKDSFLADASDGVLDTKEAFAAKYCEFSNAYRILRVRKNSYIQSCSVNKPMKNTLGETVGAYVWFPDPTVKLYVLNCTFDGQPTIPLDRIHMENGTFDPAQIVYLTAPEGLLLDPFFNESAPVPTPSPWKPVKSTPDGLDTGLEWCKVKLDTTTVYKIFRDKQSGSICK